VRTRLGPVEDPISGLGQAGEVRQLLEGVRANAVVAAVEAVEASWSETLGVVVAEVVYSWCFVREQVYMVFR